MVPAQMAIDEKMACLKAQQVNAKYGKRSEGPSTYIRSVDADAWIKKHKFDDLRRDRDIAFKESEDINRKNIEFAKNLFISWDDDGSGVLESEEIIRPLISLGLAPNSDFAIRLMQALDPNSRQKSNPVDLKITLEDFVRIFRSNKVSEGLLNMIQSETEKRHKANQ